MAPNLAPQRHGDPSSRSAHNLSTKQQGQQAPLTRSPLSRTGAPILYPSPPPQGNSPLPSLRPSSRAHCHSRKTLPLTRQTLTLSCRTRSFPLYSRAETWLPLCINKKHITKHFPQMPAPGLQHTEKGWSSESFPHRA